MARPACLYCGAALPADTLAEAIASSVVAQGPSDSPSAPTPTGTLLVLDYSAADAATLGRALGLLPYESALRQKRGGYVLERVLLPAEAEEEAARLRANGLVVFLVPEALTKPEPWLAVGGVRETDGLRLRGATGTRLVLGSEILLVVRGPIVRQYQSPLKRRKIQTTRLEDGYRFHLHLRDSPEVLEIDPGDFDFGARPPLFGSSLLEMGDWMEVLAQGVAIDDTFRHTTPALGPSAPAARGPLAATAALSRSAAARQPETEATVHDNLRQFRFHSSWRGAVERARLQPA